MDEKKLVTIKNDRKHDRILYYNYQKKIFYKMNYEDSTKNNRVIIISAIFIALVQPFNNLLMKSYQIISRGDGLLVRFLFLIALATLSYSLIYYFIKTNVRRSIQYLEEVYIEESLIKSYKRENMITAIVAIIIILLSGVSTIIVFFYVLLNPNSTIITAYWVGIITIPSINFLLHPIELYKFSRRKDYTDLDQYKKMKEEIR